MSGICTACFFLSNSDLLCSFKGSCDGEHLVPSARDTDKFKQLCFDRAMKNLINRLLLERMAQEISLVYPPFPKAKFIKRSSSLDGLELKARVLKVTAELKKNLPENYPVALSILVKTMERDELSGFDLWPFSEYIGQFGLEHFEESLHAMMVLTERFTSEFAVRPFFLKDHARVLKFFSNHVAHKNHHIRRWISEGARPLLPWGERLPQFVADPTPTLQLLESLKFDEELYVRKSVANHINDISKHHPELVILTIGRWVRTSPPEHVDKIQWIKRHGLRTLIKKGNPDALKLMGVTGKAKIKAGRIKLNQKQFLLNDRLEFEIELQSTAKQSQRLIVDYLIDFQKANGKKGSKVFKLKMIEINTGESILIRKVHHLRKISTMTYYKGPHQVMIQVNGEIIASAVWQFYP